MRPEGCIYSDPPHDQQVSLEPFGLPRTQDELRRRPAPEVATPRPTRGIVDKPTPLRTTPRCDSRSHLEKNHGVRCGQTMFMKQVSRPVDGLDPLSWPPEAEKVERTRRKTSSRARSEVSVPHRLGG